ncbi:MAG: hypothetical protein AB8B99_15235 [Phormidesmis sp.]
MNMSQVQKLLKEKIDSQQISEDAAPSMEAIETFEQAIHKSFDELEKLSETLQTSSSDLLVMTLKSKPVPPNGDPPDWYCELFPNAKGCKSNDR